MKKTLLISLMASSFVMAQNNTILDSEFTFDPSVAVVGGAMKADYSDADWNGLYGVELGFNCLINDSIRQAVQLTSFKDGDLEILQGNVNPQYEVAVSDTVNVGFGPTVGLASIDNGTDTDTVFTYGVGTSLNVNLTKDIFLGTELKYELTEDADLGEVSDNFNNFKAFAKIGYQF